MINCTIDDAVTDWVIDHPETEEVFKNLQIDYHCAGKSLEYLCRQQGLDVQQVLQMLHEKIEGAGTSNSPNSSEKQ